MKTQINTAFHVDDNCLDEEVIMRVCLMPDVTRGATSLEGTVIKQSMALDLQALFVDNSLEADINEPQIFFPGDFSS